MRKTLESGAWIECKTMGDLLGRDKRAVMAAGLPAAGSVPFGANGTPDMGALLSSISPMGIAARKQDAVWAVVIDKWSYAFDVPTIRLESGDAVFENEANFEEIPLEDFEEIEQFMKPYAERLQRTPDPKGRTSYASNGSSKGKALTSQTG